MKSPGRKQLCSVVLAALLFLPAMPAAAAPAGGGIDLQLEKALALQGADFLLAGSAADEGLASGLDEPGERALAPELKRRSLEEVALELRQKADDDPDRQPAAKGGFGRWVKKHWYVPVLAAAAIGVAVAGSDDNDRTGEED